MGSDLVVCAQVVLALRVPGEDDGMNAVPLEPKRDETIQAQAERLGDRTQLGTGDALGNINRDGHATTAARFGCPDGFSGEVHMSNVFGAASSIDRSPHVTGYTCNSWLDAIGVVFVTRRRTTTLVE